jgi:hypothetical protein
VFDFFFFVMHFFSIILISNVLSIKKIPGTEISSQGYMKEANL